MLGLDDDRETSRAVFTVAVAMGSWGETIKFVFNRKRVDPMIPAQNGPKTLIEQFVDSPDGMRSFQQEAAIYEVTELIEDRLSQMGLSRSELAAKLGKTEGWVTQLLDGESNKTIRTVADVFAVLGRSIHFSDVPLEISSAGDLSADAPHPPAAPIVDSC